MTLIDEFHGYADHCRQIAQSSRDPETQSLWTGMADRWMRLAGDRETAERQAHATPKPKRPKPTWFQRIYLH